jgi:hypothetical protein
MKFLFVLVLAAIATTTLPVGEAHAGLLADGGCSMASASNSEEMGVTYAAIGGLSCEQLLRFDDKVQLVRMAIEPLENVMKIPAVQAVLASQATRVGSILMANPAVLAVTVIGAAGIYTSYVIVQASIADCKKMEPSRLKAEIDKDLQQRYGLKPVKSMPLEIQD